MIDNDIQIFVVKKMAFIFLKILTTLHAGPANQRVRLTGRTANQHPFPSSDKSPTDDPAHLFTVFNTQE